MPALLDLFCGAGGCSVGYHRAGFTVAGVDIDGRGFLPPYPFELRVADALDVLADTAFLSQFDVVHASPPCQGYTTMSNRYRGAGGWTDTHPKLIAEVRRRLVAWGGVWVIENVEGASSELVDPVRLTGGMFGLGVHRPRLFESNVPLRVPAPARAPAGVLGVYGSKPDGRWLQRDPNGVVTQRAPRTLAEGQAAMGIDWMDWADLTEAVPPAYTEYLGWQLAARFVPAGGEPLRP